MATVRLPRLVLALALPTVVFLFCAVVAFTGFYHQHADRLSMPILVDLLVTAPLFYYLAIRKTTVPKISVLRVFLAGSVLAAVLLSGAQTPGLHLVKTWLSPLIESMLIGWIAWTFYKANQQHQHHSKQHCDFLLHARIILKTVLGSEKLADVLASEIAVFYYLLSRKKTATAGEIEFSCYKANGIRLVLITFLFLFLVETAALHFLFQLWSKTAAWVLTGISVYTCLQLWAHIRALKTRPVSLTATHLYLRNGLMGGDALLSLANIARAEQTKEGPEEKAVIKLALLNGLEKHNVAIYLNQPVVVYKAFGIRKKASVLLVSIDAAKEFLAALEQRMQQ